MYTLVQADTSWWKPVAFKSDDRTWENSNALVYKQAFHPRLAYRILKGSGSGLQESL